jgi:hypothetical protein
MSRQNQNPDPASGSITNWPSVSGSIFQDCGSADPDQKGNIYAFITRLILLYPGLPDSNCYPAWLTLLQNQEDKTQVFFEKYILKQFPSSTVKMYFDKTKFLPYTSVKID